MTLPTSLILAAVCLIAGFILILRGVGGNESAGSLKFLGLEFTLSRVGPGVLFALFGVVLAVFGMRGDRADDRQSDAQSPQTKPITDSGKPAGTVNNAVTNNAPVTNQVNCVYVVNSQLATGGVSVQTPTERCGLTETEARSLAVENLETARDSLQMVLSAKSRYFFPALEKYRRNTDPQKRAAYWKEVGDQAKTISTLVKEAVNSLVHLDPKYEQLLGPRLNKIAGNLVSRGASMYTIADSPPPSAEDVDRIESEQRKLYDQLHSEIEDLISNVSSAGS